MSVSFGHQSQQGAEEVKVGKQFETHPEAAAVPRLADDTCQSQQVHQQKIELVASGQRLAQDMDDA